MTEVFIVLLLLMTATRLWLGGRQIRHVLAHRNQVPSEFSQRIGLRSHQRAADYTVSRVHLTYIEVLLDAAILLILTLGGGLQWIWQAVQAWTGDSLWTELLFTGAVIALVSIAHLPLNIYRQFGLEERFGFNRMTPRLYVTDLFKGIAVGLLLGTPLLALILWLMDMAGSLWWLWAWGAWALFNVILLVIFPIWIAPVFNKFTPLQDDALRERVENLAKRCQFNIQGLFVMDGSRRSAHGNAYFTGIGKSRRIVFFDTLLKKLSHEEIEAVLAHELGHFKHHHITKRILLSLLAALIFFGALGFLSQAPWFYTGLGVAVPPPSHMGAMALILFVMILPLVTFWLTPVMNALSRRDEFEADRFAADQSEAEQLVSALVKLFNDNAATLTPDPLYSAFYDSHPPAAVRIAHLTS